MTQSLGLPRCFNPRPSCEGRLQSVKVRNSGNTFQSTPLMRGATAVPCIRCRGTTCFNPRPSCEGRQAPSAFRRSSHRFNPRPSCEGRPLMLSVLGPVFCFNPRPSCEGRHSRPSHRARLARSFNPRPSCEGRRMLSVFRVLVVLVSIHAPHARGDRWARTTCATPTGFNPRPSCEGRHYPTFIVGGLAF